MARLLGSSWLLIQKQGGEKATIIYWQPPLIFTAAQKDELKTLVEPPKPPPASDSHFSVALPSPWLLEERRVCSSSCTRGVAMLHVHLSLCGAIFNLSQGELCLCLSCLAVHTKNYLCFWKKGVPVLFWDLKQTAVFIAKSGGEKKCSSSQNLWHQVLVVAEQSSKM